MARRIHVASDDVADLLAAVAVAGGDKVWAYDPDGDEWEVLFG
jgi:hypothetical protein